MSSIKTSSRGGISLRNISSFAIASRFISVGKTIFKALATVDHDKICLLILSVAAIAVVDGLVELISGVCK